MKARANMVDLETGQAPFLTERQEKQKMWRNRFPDL